MTHLITYITYDHVCVSLFRSFREELTKELINEPTRELTNELYKRTLRENSFENSVKNPPLAGEEKWWVFKFFSLNRQLLMKIIN